MDLENFQIFFYIVASATMLALLIVAIMFAFTIIKIRQTIESRIRGFQAIQSLMKISFLRSLLRLLR